VQLVRKRRRSRGARQWFFSASDAFAPDSALEGTGFEPSVPPRKRRPSRVAPRPTIVVSRDDLRLMARSNLSVRHLSSATAERPSTRAGANHRFLSCSVPSVDGRGSSSSCSTWSGGFRGLPLAADGEELQEIAGFSRDIEKSRAEAGWTSSCVASNCDRAESANFRSLSRWGRVLKTDRLDTELLTRVLALLNFKRLDTPGFSDGAPRSARSSSRP
jgi:hypothetical protein